MKEIIVKNYKTEKGLEQGEGKNKFTVKPVLAPADINKCSANFVEVEPGNTAYGYHWHEANEEVFYIISGEASVKTENGEIRLKQGDAVFFPADIKGSHVISNPSATEKLVYLDFGTAERPDIVHFTGTQSGMAVSADGTVYMFKK